MSVPRDLYLSYNSDTARGGTTNLGSEFSVGFGSGGLSLPSEAKNVSLSLVRGTFWWTIPNLTDDAKLTIELLEDNGTPLVLPGSPNPFTIIFPRGLYSYTTVNDTINREILERVTDPDFPSGAIALDASGATENFLLTFKTRAKVTFHEDELATLTGFDAGQEVEEGTGGYVVAPNLANFDQIQYLQVGTDLVADGFTTDGGASTNIIAQIKINVKPYFQITYDPSIPLELPAALITRDNPRYAAKFYLYDQNGAPVDTGGQPWSVLIRLRYYV